MTILIEIDETKWNAILAQAGGDDGLDAELQDYRIIRADVQKVVTDLLTETNQHASGNCPKLHTACRNARALIKVLKGSQS